MSSPPSASSSSVPPLPLPTTPDLSADAMQVDDASTSESHTASADSAQLQQPSGGVLLGFGSGFFGMLGDADESVRPAPVRIPNFNALLSSVAVGATHALAVGTDGSLYSWGSSDEGQLGHGDRQSRTTPAELRSLQTRQIVAAAAGYAHSVVLSSAGEVLAFGSGEMAALGLTVRQRPKGTPPDLSTHVVPALVRELAQLTRIVQVACGDSHTLALSSAGRVYSCGDGSRGG
jgi:alpha-tubulin suppressor-like RCC1 family protein